MEGTGGVYRPRQPKLSQFYQCIEEHFEHFEQLYPERYERQYGFWRPVVQEVILKYLDCGDLHQGFARIGCQECGQEYLLAFSCKGRYFCPSCHQCVFRPKLTTHSGLSYHPFWKILTTDSGK